MELKTDGGIYLTRETYREYVEKVMEKQAKAAVVAMMKACVEDDIDPKKATAAVNDALHLQAQTLQNMERELFGKPVTQDEEAKKEND